MHRRRPLVAVVLLLVGGLLAVGAPARAATILLWDFDQRPAGLPATAEPAQTLAAANADLALGPESAALRATVELAGVPTPETGSDLHLRVGTVEDGACRTDWEIVVPTLDSTGPASRDGTTIRVAVSMGPQADNGLRCASVSLVAADGVVLDRLEDDESGLVVADPGAQSRIERVTSTRVRPGHWSTVWVRVGHHGAEADGIRVTGRGDGVRVRAHTTHLTLRDGDEIWVPLRVLLRGDRARELTITARPFGHLAFAFAGKREVLLRPVR